MSAMFSTTPSHSRPSLRFSRASSITSSTCSTPWSEKYSPSALTSAWVAATSALTVSRPSAGGQSIRIRSCWRRDSRSARFSVSSRPIFPLSTSSASARPRFAGIMFLWIASTARAGRPAPRRSWAWRPGRRRSSRRGCPAGRGRPASTSRPTRRSTSVSVRTIVVLPVPPFCERTAIVGREGRMVGHQDPACDRLAPSGAEMSANCEKNALPQPHRRRRLCNLRPDYNSASTRTRRAPARRRRGTREDR